MHLYCRVLPTLAIVLFAGSGQSGEASTTSRASEGSAQQRIVLDEEFALRVGQTAALAGGTGVRLIFEAVREDSRCPVGVSCIWAGDAVVAITMHNTDGGPTTIELHTNVRFDAEAVPDGHVVRLVRLSPTPRVDATIEVDQYEATLVVNRFTE